MTGLIKSPMKYFNVRVETDPVTLGRFMTDHGLEVVSVYETPGWMITYHLVDGLAKEAGPR